jgi:hypothetical protein
MSKCHFSVVGPGNSRNLLAEFRPTRAKEQQGYAQLGKLPNDFVRLYAPLVQRESSKEIAHQRRKPQLP